MYHSRHARHHTPPASNVHGLGLSAGTSPPRQLEAQKQVRHYDMPSLPPLRIQQLSPPQPLRPNDPPEDPSRPVPTRSSSLKNRKSRRIRRASVGSPLLSQVEESVTDENERATSDFGFVPRNLDLYPHQGHTPQVPFSFDTTTDHRRTGSASILSYNKPTSRLGVDHLLQRPKFARGNTSYHTAHDSLSDGGENGLSPEMSHSQNSSWSIQSSHRSSPLRQQFNAGLSILGTKSNAHAEDLLNDMDGNGIDPRFSLLGNDDLHLYGTADPLPQTVAELQKVIEELREELRGVSVELATSIQREMDLEDEVDKLTTELRVGVNERNRRTSDYFSDSSASSARLSAAQGELRIETLERMRRKAEQEKAQMRRDMAQKLEEDLVQKRTLESHRQSLEDQLRAWQNADATTGALKQKAKDLEASLDDTRRRLNDERQIRENIEELLRGMQQDMQSNKIQHKDASSEVIPQLRARIVSLEKETAQTRQLTEENTRLHQDLQSLNAKHEALINIRKVQPNQKIVASTTHEEDLVSPTSPPIGISRNASSAKRRSLKFASGVPTEIAEFPTESLKELEEQRDALQVTLKNLIFRYDHETKQHAKQILVLQKERDRALNRHTKRTSLNSEVQHLRVEVDRIRQYANETVEQKWQCEKGLSGLGIDLDRAQQETNGLRMLLQDLESTMPSKSQVGHGDTNTELRSQIGTNTDLHNRLSEAIKRGEWEQRACARRIVELQASLKAAEEKVFAAQNVSEEVVEEQEELVKDLKDAQREGTQRGIIRRSTTGLKRTSTIQSSDEGRPTGTKDPGNALLLKGLRPLRMSSSRYGVSDPANTEAFKASVKELEDASSVTEREIRGIVNTMSKAQTEAADLQAECDEAFKRTRLLQRQMLFGTDRSQTPSPH